MKIFNKIKNWFIKRRLEKIKKDLPKFKNKLKTVLLVGLQKLDSDKVDTVETQLIILGIQAAQSYFGCSILDDEIKKTIAEEVVDILGKINHKAQDIVEG